MATAVVLNDRAIAGELSAQPTAPIRTHDRMQDIGAPLDVLIDNAGVQHAIDLAAGGGAGVEKRVVEKVTLNRAGPMLLGLAQEPPDHVRLEHQRSEN